MGLRNTRADGQGAPVMRRCVLEPALGVADIAEVDMRVGVIGPQRRGSSVVPDRFIRPALRRQRISEIVVRLGKIRLQGYGDPKACDTFGSALIIPAPASR